QVVNTSLMTDLMNLGLWSEEMRHLIIEYDGSIQNIPLIPQHIKDLYKTVWEIKMRSVVDMAIDRQPYIDQSQSLNIFMERPTYQSVSSMHFHGWKNGLKTGLYYLRSKPISSAIKFTVDQELVERTLSSLQEMENSKGDSENMYNTCESCSC
ncbi:ribonucleoside-diphosphate reductase subunit M1, partial [Pancytospora epiphaga]